MCNKFYLGEDDSLPLTKHVVGSPLQYFLISNFIALQENTISAIAN
jgi:hypothetical protein